MSDRSGILSYFHCRTCFEQHREPFGPYVVGLADPYTLRVWCEGCDRLMGDLRLAHPMTPRCDQCGEPITATHRH